ncbi:DUF1345 domain-containing protein [Pedobacter psychrodurus]|uniref:DUF1345 domain-containing protein n=1 Tax=Pedobacter psychrodurus TaxID=2530456 RepID=A0A4R0PWZ6_9SPHI|nr:DUF1345 domain-containing protein [Pedobacter psychrodurus]TCD27323.1 DUF1345 domain-containing protein [Pedobacter psychrodurus]
MNVEPKLEGIQKRSAMFILLISLFTGIAFFLVSLFIEMSVLTHIMLGWDVFCLILITLHWYMFFHTSAAETHLKAKMQDETRGEIFAIVVVSTFAGLLAVILLLINKDIEPLDLVVAIAGMFLSWFLVHTTFSMRYAHLYYGGDKKKHIDKKGAGLEFPGDDEPDFIDFAYFSFVLGMTFQVSDVEISSREIRRLSLLHSLIAFIFNTVIVALTINALAGLSK